MKKILAIITLATLVFGLGVNIALAVDPVGSDQKNQLNDCCKIRQTFTVNGVTYTKGDIAGAVNAAWCDTDSDGTKNDITSGKATGDWGLACMLNTVYTITNWVFYIMTLVAVLMIIYGGFVYLTGAGDPAKATKGKGILTFAVIGLAIALLAKLIPSLVRFILGM